jgi:outer membrane protein assembly factor BamD (BamD/ComL family)
MERTGAFIRGLVLAVLGILLVGAIAWRWLRGSRDTAAVLVGKWIATALVLGVLFLEIVPGIVQGGGGAMLVPFIAVCGLILAIIWTPNIAAALAKPFGDLFDGGSVEADPEPLYSISIARRKQSKPLEAIAEIRKQLAHFPNDVAGQMMLAEIQAEDLNDLQGAQITIERFCSQEGHAPKNISYALNALADWQIKYAQDVEGARQTLGRIGDLLPDSEEALLAAQRLSHMGDANYLLSRGNRPAIAMKAGVDNIGLIKNYEPLKPVEEDKAELAQNHVAHLEKYPMDLEVRERLAILYAEHYHRIDLAADQMEQIIAQPGQPMKQVVHYLNLLADLHIREARDVEAARRALERIIELYPKYAPAENARQRMAHLRLEMKGHETREGVKLGTYEQNIGLKKFKTPGVPE